MTAQNTGLAGRYAVALFDLANADNALDAVAEDLATLGAMIFESEDLRRLVKSPVVSRADQEKALLAIAEKAGMNALTQNFLGVIAQNRRISALSGIIRAYQAILADHRGETTAEVVSAKELTKTQMTALKDALKQAVGTDVAVDAKVDTGLLGGLIVKIGSQMVDSSLRTKLQQLRLAMKGIG
ncbi:MAG: F0F1 ATP synthase subunit delta [Rhodospirillales bacterium]|nr:F0F1 ATP synthase subunit delta [Rhodospirillales bacterium]